MEDSCSLYLREALRHHTRGRNPHQAYSIRYYIFLAMQLQSSKRGVVIFITVYEVLVRPNRGIEAATVITPSKTV